MIECVHQERASLIGMRLRTDPQWLGDCAYYLAPRLIGSRPRYQLSS